MTCAAAWLAVALAGTAGAMPAPADCAPATLPAQSVADAGRGRKASVEVSPAIVAQAPRSPELPRARDGEVAIREEYEAARRAGTREASDLFIARHPDHPLARTMQEERKRLR